MRATIVLLVLGLYIAVLIGSMAAVLILNPLLRRRLRLEHPALWRQLGEPNSGDILLRRDDGSLWRWLSEHGEAGLDAETRRLARSLRIASYALLGSAAIAVLITLAGKLVR